MGFAALNTGNNLLYLVLALMLSFLVLSGILSESALRGIRIERRLPRELYAAAPNRIVLRVSNRLERIASFAISLEDHLAVAEAGDAAATPIGRAFALRVGPGETRERSYHFEPSTRGPHAFDRVRVSTRFPFGLFVKSVDLPLVDEALVYPPRRPVRVEIEAAAVRRESAEAAGRIARGDEVTGLREYAPGDGPGRVHWRRSLRAGRWLVGEREGEAAGEREIELRTTTAMSEAAFEEAVARAASEIQCHLEAGFRVGLRSANERFAPAASAAHRRALLGYLACVDRSELEATRAPEASAS